MIRGKIIGLIGVGILIVLYFIYKKNTQVSASGSSTAETPPVSPSLQSGSIDTSIPAPLQPVGSNASPIPAQSIGIIQVPQYEKDLRFLTSV